MKKFFFVILFLVSTKILFSYNGGNAIVFNGSGSCYVTTNCSASSDTLTTECWVKILQFPNPNPYNTSFAGIICADNGNYGKGFGIRTTTNGGHNWEVQVGTGSWQPCPFTNSLNEWIYVSCCYYKSNNIFYVKFIVNNVEYNYTGANYTASNTGNIQIGSDISCGPCTINGTIDEVKIWKKIRTVSEISNGKNISYICPQQKLIAYWKFNEDGSLCYDSSGSGYNYLATKFNTNSVASTAEVNYSCSSLSNPILLSPSNNSINNSLTPTLFWNTVSNALSYTVQVSSLIGFGIINDSATVTTNQHQIPNGKLNCALTYYWRVRANDEFGGSG